MRAGTGSPSNNRFKRHNVELKSCDEILLKIHNDEGSWTAAEIYSAERFGYGRFDISFSFRAVPERNVVFGMFLYPYGEKSVPGTREIDFEVSQWASTAYNNFRMSVYPADFGVTRQRDTYMDLKSATINLAIVWMKDKVSFLHVLDQDEVLLWEADSNINARVPTPPLNFVFNFWIFRGPKEYQKDEAVAVKRFFYKPE